MDTDYWCQITAQGRLYRPRIDVFLNYWLTMKLLREVPSDRVFTDFRDRALPAAHSLADLLAELAADAKIYATLDSLSGESVPGRFYYRAIQALDTRSLTPVFLWLLRWSSEDLPQDQRDRALLAIESWLIRRTLARLTGKNVNLFMLELLKALDESGPSSAGERTEDFLAAQGADSRLWPDDDLVRTSLERAPVYTALLRARTRMILEVLEDDLRSEFGEGQPAPRGLTVEHILPQSWAANWPLESSDPEARLIRDRLVHRLGNLTLVSGKLNPALSNRPWTHEAGDGKRDYLLEHSSLKLNARVVAEHPQAWTEEDIRLRTAALTERLLALWPRPTTARPTPAAPDATPPADAHEAVSETDEDVHAEGHEGKYRLLWQWLSRQPGDVIELTFLQMEGILGFLLPASCRTHLPHWYGAKGSAVARAIQDAGWKASKVSLEREHVTFIRQ